MCLKRIFLCVVAFALAGMQSANAALQISSQSSIAPAGGAVHDPFQPTFAAGGPSSVDLLQGTLPSSSTGNFTQELSAGPVALTDGSDATVYPQGGSGGDAIDHAPYASGGPGAGTSLTYALGGLYDLSSIVVYGGWNDGGRDAQRYNILTSSNGGASFTLLGAFDQDETGEAGTTPIGWRVAFTESVLPSLVQDVTHLRFDFLAVENGYTGYSEIDVFGVQQNVPGDADGNGLVNIYDFNVISNHFLRVPSAAGADGDLDASNFVDAADFRIWKNIASPAVLAQLNGLQIPEPTSLAIAAVAVMLLGGRRFGRRS